MVDFNGFDKGVIGKNLPSDTTLNCMKKAELIKLLHLAENNHRTLAEAYKIVVDTNKCKICPLELDKRRANEIRAEVIDAFVNELKEVAFPLSNIIDYLRGEAIDMDDVLWIADKLKEEKNE